MRWFDWSQANDAESFVDGWIEESLKHMRSDPKNNYTFHQSGNRVVLAHKDGDNYIEVQVLQPIRSKSFRRDGDDA